MDATRPLASRRRGASSLFDIEEGVVLRDEARVEMPMSPSSSSPSRSTLCACIAD
jgi:hypothetical protein